MSDSPFVDAESFERMIDDVRASTRDSAHGLFGPGSAAWQVARESVVFFGAGRAALLQLAHPYVAQAIEDHSETKSDPISRFYRTFRNVYAMIFGDLDAAIAAARRVRRVHDSITGSIAEDLGRFPSGHRYTAADVGAIRWVFATLVETAFMAYDTAYGPLDRGRKSECYSEFKRFAALFGLSHAMLPVNLDAFENYCEAMFAGDELAVGESARDVAGFLMHTANPAMQPAMRAYRAITAGMLPPRIRDGYGWTYTRSDAMIFEGAKRTLARVAPWVPDRLRYRPEYHEAMWRIEGRARKDSFGRALEGFVLRAVRPGANSGPHPQPESTGVNHS